jgi:hypothetical protein
MHTVTLHILIQLAFWLHSHLRDQLLQQLLSIQPKLLSTGFHRLQKAQK